MSDKTKVYKAELLIIDHDGIGQLELINVLENIKYPNWCINPSVMSLEAREIEWSDDHPLNIKDKSWDAYRDLFEVKS